MSTALRFTLLGEPTEENLTLDGGGGGGGGGFIRSAGQVTTRTKPTPTPTPTPTPEQPTAVPVTATVTDFAPTPTQSFTPQAQPAPLAETDKVGQPMIGPQPEATATAIPEVKVTTGQRDYLTLLGVVLAVVGVGVAIWAATKR